MQILADKHDAAGKPGNNTMATAVDMTLAAHTGSSATIHSATDVDYYRFVLDGEGKSGNFARINFAGADGDLDLIVVDAAGNVVASSETRGTDSETVSFAGLAAGTYYIRVQGHAGAVNNYTLDWDRTNYNPVADKHDAAGKPGNNTVSTAVDMSLAAHTGSSATIHSASDVDYYRFVLGGEGKSGNFARINFAGADGDLDLIVVDAAGNVVASSETRGTDSETVSFAGLAAGTYYIRVQGHAGAVNNYTLDWDRTNYNPVADKHDAAGKPGNNTMSTAVDMSLAAHTGSSATIHSATDVDYYRFVLDGEGKSGNFARINFAGADGDLDLIVVDAAGNVVASSETRGTDSETVSFAGLGAGTYYIRVQGHAGAVNNYTLDWDRTNYNPVADKHDAAGKPGNNTASNAVDMALELHNGSSASIHSSTDVDYYRFVLGSVGSDKNFARINFAGADGDLDLIVVDAAGNVVASSETRGTNSEKVSFGGLDAGTYYVRVQGYSGAVNNYTLDWDRTNYNPVADKHDAVGKPGNDTASNAVNMALEIHNGSSASIHSRTDVDYYKFVLAGAGRTRNFARINFNGADGDLDLIVVDAAGNVVASSETRGTNSEKVSFGGLDAGTYYVRVQGYSGAVNNYTLDWDRKNYAPAADSNDTKGKDNNSLQKATNCAFLTASGLGATIHSATDVDFYKLVLEGEGTANNFAKINFDGKEGDLDLFLYDESGALLYGSESRGSDSELISLQGYMPGIYYLKVAGHDKDINNYTLAWDRSNYGLLADECDKIGKPGNNTLNTAVSLGNTLSNGSARSIHSRLDVDFYTFSIASEGKSNNFAQIIFNSQNGQLDFQLLDANGNNINSGHTSNSDSKRYDLSGLQAGKYYLKVSGNNGAKNTYSLSWNIADYAPVADGNDAAGKPGNNSIETATNMAFAVAKDAKASIHSATDTDYYRLALDGRGTLANFARIIFIESDGELALDLLDSAGNSITNAITSGVGQVSANLAGLSAGTYYLKISGIGGATNNYTLSWDRTNYAPARDGNDASGKPGNNSIDSATAMVAMSAQNARATIHSPDDNDYYKFELSETGNQKNYVSIGFDKGIGELDLQILDSASNEISGIVKSHKNEKYADLKGLAEGTYYVRVFSNAGHVNSYTLNWDKSRGDLPADKNDLPEKPGNNTIETATNIATFTGTSSSANIHTATDIDFYKIELPGIGSSRNHVFITFDESMGKLDLHLYDSAGNNVACPSDKSTGKIKLNLAGLEAGTWYAAVSGVDNSVNSYTLGWDRTAYVDADKNDQPGAPGNNSIATSTVASATSATGASATIHSATDVDYYTIVLNSKGSTNNYFQLDFNNSHGNLDLALYDIDGNEIMGSYSTTNNYERLDLAGLDAGAYFVKVFGNNGDVNRYTISWDRTAYTIKPVNDVYENNNTLANAKELHHNIGGQTRGTSLGSASDVDYFRFGLPMRGTSSNYFSISGINASGTVELALLDSRGRQLRKAVSTSRTSQKLDLAYLDPGNYYIKISSPNGGIGNYDMNWNCWSYHSTLAMKEHPGRWAADRFETDNEDQVTLFGYSGTASGLNIHNPDDLDYYRITLFETGSSANYTSITYNTDWGQLALALYDSAGNLVKLSDSRSGTETVNMAGLAAGTYYAEVKASETSGNNAYNLSWSRRPADAPVINYSLDAFRGTNNLSLAENTPAHNLSFTLATAATADNYIYVRSEQPLTTRIRDQHGRILSQSTSRERINLGGLGSGNYTLEVRAGDLINGQKCDYTLDYDIDVHIRGAKVRGSEYSSLFSLGGSEYASIHGYGNVTLADFYAGTYHGERLRSKDDPIYYDAEKCRSDQKDDNQCWAATASNMLAYSGWGERGISSAVGEYAEDIIFDTFNAAFPNAGGHVNCGLRWFFGPNYRTFSNCRTVSPGNYLGIEGAPYITMNDIGSVAAMDQLASSLQNGKAVGISISGSIQHALNVWGYSFNSAYEKGSAGYYTGLFITDSNDGAQAINAVDSADNLQLIPISWDSAANGYYTSYSGINRIETFYTLDQAPDTDIALAENTYSFSSPADDIPENHPLDGLLAQAMEPVAAAFQTDSHFTEENRQKEYVGILSA